MLREASNGDVPVTVGRSNGHAVYIKHWVGHASTVVVGAPVCIVEGQ